MYIGLVLTNEYYTQGKNGSCIIVAKRHMYSESQNNICKSLNTEIKIEIKKYGNNESAVTYSPYMIQATGPKLITDTQHSTLKTQCI